MNRTIDIICIGEVLIDFIGHQSGVGINETKDYHRYLGGSPTNVAMNCSRLDLNSKLIACIGDDGFGDYIFKRFDEVGVNYSQIKSLKEKYSKLIEENKGNLVQTQEWGLLNLSYLIKKNKKGNYIHFKIKGNGELIKELEKNERIDKNLLRYVTIKVKKFD